MSEHTVEIPALPTTVEEFLTLRGDLATTHRGGAAVFVVALHQYGLDPELGLKFLTIAIERPQLSDDPDGYKGKAPSRRAQQAFKERVGGRPYVARSYFRGTTPQNRYTIPDPPLVVAIREQGLAGELTEDTAKVFVHSSGADSPRPLHLSKNNRGLWKASNWSSLEVGVRPPVVDEDDDI